MPATRTNGLATASLVTGILGLLCCGLVLGIPALITGYMGYQRSNEPGVGGRGMAIAGMVCGALATMWSLIWIGMTLAGGTTIHVGS